MNPLVTVFLRSYNHSEYVEDAVESVFNQTYKNWELIIIDNGSTDGSQQLLRKYADNPRVRLILHDKNGSISKCDNKAVRLSRGEYISLLFSDDYYLPEKLEKQIKCFEGLTSEWGVVHSPGYELNVFSGKQTIENCMPVSGYILKDLFTRFNEGFINPLSPLVRKECFERYPYYEDLFFEGESIYFRIAMKYKFYFIDEPLVVMREHDRNSRFAAKENAAIGQTVLDRLSVHPDFPKTHLPYLRAFQGRAWRMHGWHELRFGSDVAWARKMFFLSVSADWKQLFHPRTIVGWALSYLPGYVRSGFNNLVNKITKRENVITLENFYQGKVS